MFVTACRSTEISSSMTYSHVFAINIWILFWSMKAVSGKYNIVDIGNALGSAKKPNDF